MANLPTLIITGEELKALRIKKDITQEQLADALGISRNNIGNWERPGGEITKYKDIYVICKYFDIPLPGTEEIYAHDNTGDKDLSKLIPYYEIDILAGRQDLQLFNDSSIEPSYYMDIPEYVGCSAFRVFSDSMSPLMVPGTIMFCRPVNNWRDYLEYGQIYSVQTIDYRRFLKYIRKSKKADHFLLRSHNATEYDDFEIAVENVISVWLVEGWLGKRTQ